MYAPIFASSGGARQPRATDQKKFPLEKLELRSISRDMGPSAIALRGLDQAQAKLEQAAACLASSGAASTDGAPVDTLDLSTAMVALLSARNEFATNTKVLATADDIERQTISLSWTSTASRVAWETSPPPPRTG